MKKFIRNNIVGFLLGAILFSGITVYAVTRLKAEEVSYNKVNVKEAIDDLYTKTLTSGDCVEGWHQLTDDARTSVGDKIIDFSPSVFLFVFYNKNLPLGGSESNGGVVYYNKKHSEDSIYLMFLNNAKNGSTVPLSSFFTMNNNLILKNFDSNSWKTGETFYMACK